MAARTSAQLQAIINAALRGHLDQAAAERLHAFGPEAVGIAMLAVSKRIAELQGAAQPTPSTPSGMIPIYAKANVSKWRKKPGARPGHPGVRRATPRRIGHRQSHRLKRCPHCDCQLQRCQRSRTRIIEDIPEDIQPVVTEHTIHRDYCPTCKKHVEPVVPDAMPGATLGHHLIALTKLVPLRPGHHPRSDHGHSRLPSANQADVGRPDRCLAAIGRGLERLV